MQHRSPLRAMADDPKVQLQQQTQDSQETTESESDTWVRLFLLDKAKPKKETKARKRGAMKGKDMKAKKRAAMKGQGAVVGPKLRPKMRAAMKGK